MFSLLPVTILSNIYAYIFYNLFLNYFVVFRPFAVILTQKLNNFIFIPLIFLVLFDVYRDVNVCHAVLYFSALCLLKGALHISVMMEDFSNGYYIIIVFCRMRKSEYKNWVIQYFF